MKKVFVLVLLVVLLSSTALAYSMSYGGPRLITGGGPTHDVPSEYRTITQEAENEADFTIFRGDRFFIKTSNGLVGLTFTGIARNQNYITLETAQGEPLTVLYKPSNVGILHILGSRFGRFKGGGVQVSRGVYGPMTFAEAQSHSPYLTFREYAESQQLGKGVFLFDGREYKFYVANRAGSPLAMDLDGDGKLTGENVRTSNSLVTGAVTRATNYGAVYQQRRNDRIYRRPYRTIRYENFR